MQIHEFSGEELRDVASEPIMAMIARTRPEYRGRVASRELGEALTLSRSRVARRR